MTRYVTSVLAFVALAVGVQSLRASPPSPPPIGAVVQTWHYDPQTKIVTIRLVNTTQKDIVAYNLSITETFADGSTSSHEVMTDLLDRMINAQLAKGTVEEVQFTEKFGNGTFAAGKTIDQNIPETTAVTDMQIAVDMVAYADRTADVKNEGAFGRLTAYRQGESLAIQQANEIVLNVLANSVINDPSEAATIELKRRIEVLHAQNLAPDDPRRYEESHLQEVVSRLQNNQILASSLHITEIEHLKRDVADRQQRIALAKPHTQLTRTKGEGQ